jgi:phosphoribosylamine--glycine ligase
MDLETALGAVETMFGGEFGAAGAEVVIEEFMEGEEASLFVLCDGMTAVTIGTAQDHKRAFNGDAGPNTGGMGAYSPAPILDANTLEKVMHEIVKPTLKVLVSRGTPYQGVLYVGLMIKEGQPRLVEYNVRFGDPECQVLMMRLGAQAFDLIEATAKGELEAAHVNWADDHALTVVLAAQGYPGSYEKGSIIKGLEKVAQDSKNMCFHAGTTRNGDDITATGGRVLNFTARGESLGEARQQAYDMANQVEWQGGFYRTDIGWHAL